MSPRRVTPPLVAAVRRDIAEVAKRSPGIEKSAAAVLAVKLAEDIEGDDFLSSRVSAAKVLSETLASIRGVAPAEERVDRLDELTARRKARQAS